MSPTVKINDAALSKAAAELVDELVADKVASRIAAQDPTLWGADAEPEASKRLAWTSLHTTSRPLIGEITNLAGDLHQQGIDRVVLAGMGGSSLAPEVIAATEGVKLTVLDTTDAAQVADALAGDLHRTALVVSSKSGGTVETDSMRRIFAAAFTEDGIEEARRIIAVTDPGSPLSEMDGLRQVVHADPNVGGRYSALTAFGLVPSGLAGADIARLLDQAAATSDALTADSPDNPALKLGAALGAAHRAGAEKVVLASGDGLPGLGDWIEQLIAESTGKNGIGLLPVVVENASAPGFADAGDDATTVLLGAAGDAAISVDGPLGAQFLLWEYATAIAGRLIGINPFDQPDVESAKKAARALLDTPTEAPAPSFVDGSVEVHGGSGSTVDEALTAFLDQVPDGGYLAVQAYLDRLDDASAALLRPELAKRTGRQVTFGWGPRFLHSTGQYHKGGHPNGAFLQVTGAVEDDIQVPDRPYTLGKLQLAQAVGDGQVLREHGRPVLRLHLTDRAAGLVELMRAVQRH